MRAKPLPRGGAARLRGVSRAEGAACPFCKTGRASPEVGRSQKTDGVWRGAPVGRGRQVPTMVHRRAKFDHKGEFQFI